MTGAKLDRRTLLGAALTPLVLAACGGGAKNGAIDRGELKRALEVLARAPEHGFAPGAFNAERLIALSESDDRTQLKTRDRLLRAALAEYGQAQHGLSIPRRLMPASWGMRPAPYDAQAEMARAVTTGRFEAWLDDLPPPFPAYDALQLAYVSYLKLHAAGGWPTVDGKDLVALRARLAVEEPGAAQATDLGPSLNNAQLAYGLPPTGRPDKATLAALNVPASVRANQIRANLERLRWLPREDAPTRIEVNTAAATLEYYRDGELAMTMLAASGKPGDETPILTSEIRGLVLNPPWNVPEGIAANELYPKGPAYLAANNYVEQEGRLVQQPGPGSALGLVKFDFANPYSVYLHDTPSKAAFERTARQVSHGCVRLERAVDLAKAVLSHEPGWSAARVDEALAGGETKHVKLDAVIPVRLQYLTAWPAGGRIAFRPDPYGWDPRLLALLEKSQQLRVARLEAAAG